MSDTRVVLYSLLGLLVILTPLLLIGFWFMVVPSWRTPIRKLLWGPAYG
jgi:cell division septal protein FtsQ